MTTEASVPELKITVLVDNEAERGLQREHGLSLWIESGSRRILFDTGQGKALTENAGKLGIDLGSADTVILSHGHYDHTGGLRHVLNLSRGVRIYFHPSAMQPRYGIRFRIPKSIGISRRSRKAIESIPSECVVPVTKKVMIDQFIGLTGPIPRRMFYEDAGGPFFLDSLGRNPDQIEDDMALWISTQQGSVVCAGCCHAGLVNTLTYVRELTENSPIAAVIGGFHLLHSENIRLDMTISTLKTIKLKKIIPCHCTGEKAVSRMKEVLGGGVVSSGYAGYSCSF